MHDIPGLASASTARPRLPELEGEGARADVKRALKSDEKILREAAEQLSAENKW